MTKRALLLLPVLLLGCKIATIRPIESEDEAPGPQEFDAATHVDGLWSEDVPVALDQAVDLRDLLPAFAADPARARETWGRREGSGPFHVIVRGTGRVTGVDTSSRTGIAEVDVEVDYLGFDIGNEWVVGYGLDYAERDRTLPYIGVVTPDDQ